MTFPFTASISLGEILGDVSRKVAGLRALDDGKVEVLLQGKGILLGYEIEGIPTFWSVMIEMEQHIVKGFQFRCLLMKVWQQHSFGVGRPIGPGIWMYSYGSVYAIATAEKCRD